MGRLGTESAFEVLARARALEAQGREIVNTSRGPVVDEKAGKEGTGRPERPA